MEWEVREGRELNARYTYIPYIETKTCHCVLIEFHKQPQYICQAKEIIASSSTPLMPPMILYTLK